MMATTEICMTAKFAGRIRLGSTHPVCLTKEGQFHTRSNSNSNSDDDGGSAVTSVLACGLACSEVVSGRNLAQVLQPGFEFERGVLEALARGLPAPPLAVHTSSGVPPPLGLFLEALGQHLPWRHQTREEEEEGEEEDDWFVSLQVEGASAVLAAIDLMLQLRHFQQAEREEGEGGLVEALAHWQVGVCATSYHGPPSSSPGAHTPLFAQKHNQILFPLPPPVSGSGRPRSSSSEEQHREEEEQEEYLREFAVWLIEHRDTLGCLLVEPQWGSSAVARSWHPDTLRKVPH
jgi:hypothetical protein